MTDDEHAEAVRLGREFWNQVDEGHPLRVEVDRLRAELATANALLADCIKWYRFPERIANRIRAHLVKQKSAAPRGEAPGPAAGQSESKPIPMVLHCPECRARHIDEGEFATKVHHTHSCQGCGLTWRPAVVATVGVQFLPGFKNAAESRAEAEQAVLDAVRDAPRADIEFLARPAWGLPPSSWMGKVALAELARREAKP